MKKIILATITLATITFAVSAFGAEGINAKKLSAKADIALYENNATACAAWLQALESVKRIELMELEKQKLQLEVSFYKRSENLWKCVPYFIKYGKDVINMLDNDQRKAWSESSIFVKASNILLKGLEKGQVQEKDFQEIGNLMKKAEDEIKEDIKNFK